MIKSRLFILCIAIWVCFPVFAMAQNKLAVTEVLTTLQDRYEVTFSYVATDLESLTMTLPEKSLTLDQTIVSLNEHPLLNFKRIGDKRIAVAIKISDFTICGTIVDAELKQRLSGAEVYTSKEKGVITNQDGIFHLFDIQPKDVITISYLGYLDVKIEAISLIDDNDDCNLIEMAPLTLELNEVTISNFITSGLDKRMNGSIDLKTDKLGLLPGLVDPDVLQAVQVLPGIESVNESTADINIRGGTHDQNLLLWDNIKMYHSGHFFGLISAFNPEITKNINVIKNGTSAEFTDGISGTINMKSNDRIRNAFDGSIGGNLLSSDARLQVPLGNKVELHVSGRRSFTDLYTSPTYDTYFSRSFQNSRITSVPNEDINTDSKFYFYDFSGKLLYDMDDKHSIRASFINVDNELTYTETADNDPSMQETSSLSQRNTGIGITQKSNWSEKLETEIQAYHTLYNLDALDFKSRTDQSLRQLNQVSETSIKLNVRYELSNHLSLLNGYQFTETGAENASDVKNPTYQIVKKRVTRNHGTFSELIFSKHNSFVQAGIRANYFERFKSFLIEPRLSLHQKLTSRFSAKLQGEFKHQTTAQFVDLNDDFLGVENRRWVVSDELDIPIAKSKQASLGIDYDNKDWYGEITGFYKKVSNVVSESQGFRVQNQYDGSIGSYTSLGVEFLINKRFKKGSAWFSYSYGDNRYQFLEISQNEFPTNFNVAHSLSIATNYEIFENWRLSSGLIWRTGRPYSKPVDGNETFQDGNFWRVNYGDPNTFTLPDYSRVDVSIGYSLKLKNEKSLDIKIGVLNVLDKANIINRYYVVSESDETQARQVDNMSLGLAPNVSLRFDF